MAILAIALLLLEYGFYLSTEAKVILHRFNLLVVGVFLGEVLFKFIQAKKNFFRKYRVDFLIVIFFLLLLLFFTGFSHLLKISTAASLAKAYIISCQLYIVASLFLKAAQFNKAILILRLRPPLVVVLTFVSIIALGTLLLLLPKSTAAGKETTFLDALFTASSATCVTGLIVVDTGSHFSLLGRLVILFLVQIGGLGLMTFTSFFALTLGSGFGIKDRALLRDILNYRSLGRIGSLILSILVITFIIEAVGAFLLYTQFLPQAKGALSAAYLAIFHSISAFCNAGFSLYSDSFIRYQASLEINLIMSSLIILGGLGFTVMVNLLHWRPFNPKGKGERLSLQAKLVLAFTFSLIGIGTLLILLGERGGILKDLPLKEKLLGAYFQSVTARTAGFNTLKISNLTIFSAFLLIILMFIGASPGSTGGGIKTSTFATLLFTVKCMAQGKSRIEAFRRTIPRLVVYQALCVVILALGWISISTLLLTFVEDAPFINILFEDLSAFGTVGLSRGLTPELTPVGRTIIILTMLVGRIGPLTLALAIGGRKVGELYEYPEERIMIG